MATREDRILTDVATAIGSTLGAVAAQTDKIKRYVKSEKKAAVKKARGVKSRAAVAKRRTKSAAKKARRTLGRGERKVRRVVSAGKRSVKRAARRLR